MGLAELAAYLGRSAAYAALAAVPAAALARGAGGVPWRAGLAVAWPALFLVALSQVPVPPRAGLACPVPYTTPRLRPLGFLDLFAEAWGRRADPVTWLLEAGPASTVMNLALCVVIGLALGRAGARVGPATLAALALSLGIELTQLTGVWGLWPCAFRQFDVDDLILNVGGVALGAWVARRSRRGW